MIEKTKISQLQLETIINEDALIPIVQDSKTKAIKSKDLLKNTNEKIKELDAELKEIKDNTGSSTDINDSIISKKTIWSSDKVVQHGIEQDGVFWTEKEANSIAIDNTYEYKLREIEVLGDTWQDDTDSKNLIHAFEGAYNLNITNGELMSDAACQCTALIEVSIKKTIM